MESNMPTTEWSSFACPPPVTPPGGAHQPPLTCRGEDARDAWQKLIDSKLMAWHDAPNLLDDEGVDAPNKETIDRALRMARESQRRGWPAPTSVVPDPNGGIVFERREGDVSEVFHLWDDGKVEYQRFEGARLVERRPYDELV